MPQQKLNILREEYLAITGDPLIALLLNQFLFWTEKLEEIDEYLHEEAQRRTRPEESAILLSAVTEGWIRKSHTEMASKALLPVSDTTMRNYLSKLVSLGVLKSRNNPADKFDRQMQYRVDLLALNALLESHGYNPVSGFALPIQAGMTRRVAKCDTCNRKNVDCSSEDSVNVLLVKELDINMAPSATIENEAKSLQTDKPFDISSELTIQERAVGRKPKKSQKAKPRDERLDHPAVQMYRELAHLTPNDVKRQAIVEAFPAPSDKVLSEWQATIRDWIGRDWNKANVSGMIEYHAKRNPKPKYTRMLGDDVELPPVELTPLVPRPIAPIQSLEQAAASFSSIRRPMATRPTPPVIEDCPF